MSTIAELRVGELLQMADTLDRVAYGLSDPASGGAMTMSAYAAADAISRVCRDLRIMASKIDQIKTEKAKIDAMSREEMCRLYRFAPAGHPYFESQSPLWEHFEKRFKALGGFSPAISKAIGWEDKP